MLPLALALGKIGKVLYGFRRVFLKQAAHDCAFASGERRISPRLSCHEVILSDECFDPLPVSRHGFSHAARLTNVIYGTPEGRALIRIYCCLVPCDAGLAAGFGVGLCAGAVW